MEEEQSQYAPPGASIIQSDEMYGYFTVGPSKLALISLTTLELYVFYWFYRNWKIVRDQEDVKLSPFWRAIFTHLSTFSLGGRFVDHREARDIPLNFPFATI